MGQLEVIYDPEKELATIVDVDNRIGWGPAFVGPDAGRLLQGWIDTTPFDMSELNSASARDLFFGFLDRVVENDEMAQNANPDPPPLNAGDPAVSPEPAPEGGGADYNAGVPVPQPADSDMEANAGEAPQVTLCFMCQGSGNQLDDAGAVVGKCGLCKGARYVTLAS